MKTFFSRDGGPFCVVLLTPFLFAARLSAQAPANDLFVNAQSIGGASGRVTGSNVGATKESGEPSHAGNAGGRSVWYNWTAPDSGSVTIETVGSSFDTLLAVYTGSSVSTLTRVASNDDISGGTLQSRVSFSAAAGTVYRVAVDGYGGASGSISLAWSLGAASSAPANDLFVNAQTLSGASGAVTGSNANATKESGEPNHAGNAGGHSLWYTWSAPGSGSVTIDTVGSTFDSLLAVYTGGSVGSLTTVASNDDIDYASRNLQSRVTFTAVGGTLYRIAVDGYGGASGNVSLNWGQASSVPPPPPANDAFANAQSISGSSGNVTGSNANATKESGEPNHAGNAGGRSVWYTWTAPTTDPVTIQTVGSVFDTLLAVYTGSAVSALSAVASNDNIDTGNLQSRVTFTPVAGTV